MAKLHFRYGAMNAGKTTILLQTAHNYEERNQKVIIIKPKIDTKGEDNITSRIGLARKVDILLGEEDSILEKLEKYGYDINCILVDEAQFLKEKQVDELFYITKLYDIPAITFGLRTDFKTNGFEGALRLLSLADEIEEMPTICRCGRKARFNARLIDDIFQTEGESIVIDDGKKVEYEAVCGTCYVKKMEEVKTKKIAK